ncbi:MAG: Cell division protein [Candidatus Roizmanbacteria bacterium GW2011_GWA2_34_18]|uniref:Cell division protein FtsX n=1 Tax=Candidatus Roizmanbacteria bacterium GW2011_GWA2_34_18 TaxID=1618477 RepID=A0A0G0DCE3_9BACT|nr:MAG: Cell division protein [Candidatus Roizmanbacteria bacterium GW2011_GWA2_34_18]
MNQILTSIRRTPYQSLSTFLVLFFTLFLSLMLFVSLTFLYSALGYLETKPQVTVYFQKKVPEDQIFKVRDELMSSGKVLNIKYTNQNEAFNIYKQLNKDNPLLLEMVSADILPPSLEIYAKKPIYLPEIAEYLKKQGDIDEVQYEKDIINKLLVLTNTIRVSVLIFFSYLILMSIVVLTTIILFKIALKENEITLLKLIGATNFYIRKPYILESLFLGIAASTLSFGIFSLLVLYFNPFLQSYLKQVTTLSVDVYNYQLVIWPLNYVFFTIVFVSISIFGAIISSVASYIATNKYLRV